VGAPEEDEGEPGTEVVPGRQALDRGFRVGPDLEVVDAANAAQIWSWMPLCSPSASTSSRCAACASSSGVRCSPRAHPRAARRATATAARCRSTPGGHSRSDTISTASPGEEGERRRRPRGVGGAAPGRTRDDRVALTEVRHVEDDAIAASNVSIVTNTPGATATLKTSPGHRTRCRSTRVVTHPHGCVRLDHVRAQRLESAAGITAGRPHGSRPSSAEER